MSLRFGFIQIGYSAAHVQFLSVCSVEEKESRRPAPKGARKTKSGAARATWGQEAVDSLVYFLSTSSTPKEAFTSTSQRVRHPDSLSLLIL